MPTRAQRLLFGQSKGALQNAKKALKSKDVILKAAPAGTGEQAAKLLAKIDEDVDGVLGAIAVGDATKALAVQEDSLQQVAAGSPLLTRPRGAAGAEAHARPFDAASRGRSATRSSGPSAPAAR